MECSCICCLDLWEAPPFSNSVVVRLRNIKPNYTFPSALSINEQNTKAKYRRAMARFELDKAGEALQDIEGVLKELVNDDKNKTDALDLKKRIESLIDREYLERDAASSSVYRYLA